VSLLITVNLGVVRAAQYDEIVVPVAFFVRLCGVIAWPSWLRRPDVAYLSDNRRTGHEL
jgi:hypothetical protein